MKSHPETPSACNLDDQEEYTLITAREPAGNWQNKTKRLDVLISLLRTLLISRFIHPQRCVKQWSYLIFILFLIKGSFINIRRNTMHSFQLGKSRQCPICHYRTQARPVKKWANHFWVLEQALVQKKKIFLY